MNFASINQINKKFKNLIADLGSLDTSKADSYRLEWAEALEKNAKNQVPHNYNRERRRNLRNSKTVTLVFTNGETVTFDKKRKADSNVI